MKFLCDVHIPYRLVNYLISRNCIAYHVNHLFSDPRTTDQVICTHADNYNLIVVTKDADYKATHLLHRSPQKLIKLNTGNSSTLQIISLFQNNWNILLEVSRQQTFMIESDLYQFYLINY